MMTGFWKAAAAAVVFAGIAQAADNPTCSPSKKCPQEAPCCSAYGQCGVGAYCLGGCDPLSSHSFKSCVPNPKCQAADYKLNSLDGAKNIKDYLGDASKANWQYQGQPTVYQDNVLLTMAQDTVGTLMASTHYVWYGKISTKMTTSQGKGVVTAFIMMSDVKDEIDFEFVGVDIDHVQSNYYCQGVLNYHNAIQLDAKSAVETVHEYTIDWKPDTLTWLIDGQVKRVVKKSDTWNATANRFDYPQTPSRIMLSLWPAGLPSNGEGTVKWAGGLVDWNSNYMQNGYYYARVQEVNVECYDPPSGAQIAGQNSYVYTDAAATNNTIKMVDDVVVLKSLQASGENADYDPNGTSTPEQESVPGQTGGGGSSQSHEGDAPNGGSSSSGGGGGSSSGGDSNNGQGFNQNNGKNAASSTKVGGSFFAVVVAVVGLLFL